MKPSRSLIKGTLILTISGILLRVIGFLYRIFLSRSFGAEQLGLYQLIFPLYALCYSISTAGFESALSRLIASKTALKKEQEGYTILTLALLLAVSTALFIACIIHRNASVIAILLLRDKRCNVLLKLLVFTFPFSAVHGCIIGYYMGRKNARFTAISQLIEQTIRICSSLGFYGLFMLTGTRPSISIAVIGLICGEMAACVYSLCCLLKEQRKSHSKESSLSAFIRYFPTCRKELLSLSLPLTSNRVLLNLLQSTESISIPIQLCLFGHTHREALWTYGILSGMAYPCILFPTALTNAIANMILPTVASLDTSRNRTGVKDISQKTICFCFLLGCFSGLFFFLAGNWIGAFLFHSREAGSFIQQLAWICPFLYTNTILAGIINGLGYSKTTLSINAVGLLLRISAVFFLIPRYGMIGYLYGLLSSQIFVGILLLIWLRHTFLCASFYETADVLQKNRGEIEL